MMRRVMIIPNQLMTVLIPEFVPKHQSAQFLHNQTANLLRSRLRRQDNIVIIDVPYLVHGEREVAP